MAALHHIANFPTNLPDRLAKSINRIAKLDAQLFFLDVPSLSVARLEKNLDGRRAGLSIATLFENVVDPYSEPTHEGIYVNMHDVALQMNSLGWVTEQCHIYPCPWTFISVDIAVKYFRSLFNLSNRLEDRALKNLLLPFISKKENCYSLSWGLQCLVMRKKELLS